MVETLHYLARLRVASGISPFYPVPGLPGFTDRKRFPAGTAVLTKGSSIVPWTGSLSTREMVTAFRLSRFLSLLSDHTLADRHSELVTRCLDERRLYTYRSDYGGSLAVVPGVEEAMVTELLAHIDRASQ